MNIILKIFPQKNRARVLWFGRRNSQGKVQVQLPDLYPSHSLNWRYSNSEAKKQIAANMVPLPTDSNGYNLKTL